MVVFLLSGWLAASQNSHGPVNVPRTNRNLRVAWTGIGTLQSSPTALGVWQDVLGASSPFGTLATNAQQFFRVISQWGTRANLIAANSEMGVAALDGKIYVLGGYPASRVTVNTVQVYDSASNTWRLTAPLLLGVNHPMPAAANGRIYVIGGQTDTGSAYVNTVREFNPIATNWTFKATMPTARRAEMISPFTMPPGTPGKLFPTSRPNAITSPHAPLQGKSAWPEGGWKRASPAR